MTNELAWRDNSSGSSLQFDFLPPATWPAARVAAEQSAMADAIAMGIDIENDSGADSASASGAPGWLRLARQLPDGLRTALVAELRAGNTLAGIGSGNWPGEGSIVVNVHERFTVARRAPPPGVTWRAPGDPHYAREELSQQRGGVECLILC